MAIPRDLYQERLRLGVCPWCGCKRDGSTKRCSACAKLHNERTMRSRRKRTKAGVCWRCSNTVATGSVLCNLCKSTVTIATTKLYARKKAAGLCCWCSEPRTIGRFCRSCWFRGVSLRVFKTISRGDELKALFELQGRKVRLYGSRACSRKECWHRPSDTDNQRRDIGDRQSSMGNDPDKQNQERSYAR